MILDCAAVPTVISHFPEHRGRAAGLTKALVGLSGSLVAIVYQAGRDRSPPLHHRPLVAPTPLPQPNAHPSPLTRTAFSPDVVTFLLFLAIELAAVCLMATGLLRLPSADAPAHRDVSLQQPHRRLSYVTLLLVGVTTLVVASALTGTADRGVSLGYMCTIYAAFYGGLLALGRWREASPLELPPCAPPPTPPQPPNVQSPTQPLPPLPAAPLPSPSTDGVAPSADE